MDAALADTAYRKSDTGAREPVPGALVSGVSKTPKIIAQLESRPEICPHKGRAKRTLSAPTVARCGTRSHTRMQALQHIPIGWRVHTEPGTDPAPLQPEAYTCPRPNYAQTAQMCASNNMATW